MTFVATPIADSARPAPPRVLVSQLQGVAAARGASELAQRLGELDRWIGAELRDFDSVLATVPPQAISDTTRTRRARIASKLALRARDHRRCHGASWARPAWCSPSVIVRRRRSE